MLLWLSLIARVAGLILAVYQTDQVRTIYAQANRYASAPGGLIGASAPVVFGLVVSLLLLFHTKGSVSAMVRWLLARAIDLLTQWLSTDERLALSVNHFATALDSARFPKATRAKQPS